MHFIVVDGAKLKEDRATLLSPSLEAGLWYVTFPFPLLRNQVRKMILPSLISIIQCLLNEWISSGLKNIPRTNFQQPNLTLFASRGILFYNYTYMMVQVCLQYTNLKPVGNVTKLRDWAPIPNSSFASFSDLMESCTPSRTITWHTHTQKSLWKMVWKCFFLLGLS